MGTISQAPRIGTLLRRGALQIADTAYRTLWVWHFRHHTRRELHYLDQRLLRDVGISPEQARREFSKPFWEA